MSSGSFEIPPGSEKDNLGPRFRSYVIFLISLTIASICLRLWSRALLRSPDSHKGRFWWDDWVAVISVFLILAQLILSLVLVGLGVGHHVWFVSSENITTILKLLLVTYLVYGFALTATKASALLFFSRIFPSFATPWWWNTALWITHAANIAWLIAYTIVEALQCRPISRFWDTNVDGTCLSQSNIYIGASIPSVILDITILLLPVPRLWGLHTTRTRKVGLFVVFALGYGVVVVSVGRLVVALVFHHKIDEDVTYNGISSFWWGILEAPITLFGVCVPAMVPLGRRVQSMIFEPVVSKVQTTLGSSRTFGSRSRNLTLDGSTQYSERSVRKSGPYVPIEPSGADSVDLRDQSKFLHLREADKLHTSRVQVWGGGATENNNIQLQSIRVENDFTLSHM
ncbi:uncharacterized protein F4822DRAFT_413816 [Hypoxylon trugodes]|uniref:uncharacterized protein n=1 Tax=Hypoxylon trugodes TaxID=326681 RepID=UPI0021941FAD|nr:uncharacterized protein F4822DRAFT_413816 [Hypoxylon trugodes]KAI1385654.1 hypothetical protein F4822DRAFT_413816 [Hypoxylon trugodes]